MICVRGDPHTFVRNSAGSRVRHMRKAPKIRAKRPHYATDSTR